MIRRTVAVILLLSGVLGLLVEYGVLSDNDRPDMFGIVLAVCLSAAGVLLFAVGRFRTDTSGEVEKSGGDARNNSAGTSARRWRMVVIIGGGIELLVLIPVIVFTVLFGWLGFAAGEMGTMIGIFSVVALLFILPWISARMLSVWAVFRRKRWGGILALILSVTVPTVSLVLLSGDLTAAVVLLLFYGFQGWGSYRLMKQ